MNTSSSAPIPSTTSVAVSAGAPIAAISGIGAVPGVPNSATIAAVTSPSTNYLPTPASSLATSSLVTTKNTTSNVPGSSTLVSAAGNSTTSTISGIPASTNNIPKEPGTATTTTTTKKGSSTTTTATTKRRTDNRSSKKKDAADANHAPPAILNAAREAAKKVEMELQASRSGEHKRNMDALWLRDTTTTARQGKSATTTPSTSVFAEEETLILERALRANGLVFPLPSNANNTTTRRTSPTTITNTTVGDVTPQAYECLLEYLRKYTNDLVLQAQEYAWHSGRNNIEAKDIKLAVEFDEEDIPPLRLRHTTTMFMVEELNMIPLPPIPNNCFNGIVLPPIEHQLTARTFDIILTNSNVPTCNMMMHHNFTNTRMPPHQPNTYTYNKFNHADTMRGGPSQTTTPTTAPPTIPTTNTTKDSTLLSTPAIASYGANKSKQIPVILQSQKKELQQLKTEGSKTKTSTTTNDTTTIPSTIPPASSTVHTNIVAETTTATDTTMPPTSSVMENNISVEPLPSISMATIGVELPSNNLTTTPTPPEPTTLKATNIHLDSSADEARTISVEETAETTTNVEPLPSTATTTEGMEEVTNFNELSASNTSIVTSTTTKDESNSADPSGSHLDIDEATISPTVMEKVSVEANLTTTTNNEIGTELNHTTTSTVESTMMVQESSMLVATSTDTPIDREGDCCPSEEPSPNTNTATRQFKDGDITEENEAHNVYDTISTPMDLEESLTPSLKRKADEI